MSWPPFRCVVDSHPPAVSVRLSVCSGTTPPAQDACQFQTCVSNFYEACWSPSGIESLRSKFCVSLSPGGGGRSPRRSSAPLRPSRASRVGGAENKHLTSNMGKPELHATAMALLPAGAAMDTATTAAGEQQPASWLSFRLLPQPLPCKVVGPSLHEIGLSSTQRERGHKRKPSDDVQTPLQPDIGQGL